MSTGAESAPVYNGVIIMDKLLEDRGGEPVPMGG